MDIDSGQWHLEATMRLRGIREPTVAVRERCLTPEDASNPLRLFGTSIGRRCTFINPRDTGSVMTFEVVCNSKQPMKGSGKVQYRRDAFEGELQAKGESFEARSQVKGRRIGECKEGERK